MGEYKMKLIKLGNNVHELRIGSKVLLFSYETPVASFEFGSYYRTTEKHSRTTSKHINKWLNGATAQELAQCHFDMVFSY
jgi:hypothetical protein